MKTLVIHYYKSIVDGVMTSMIDTYFNLQRFETVKMSIICPNLYLLEMDDYYDFPLEEMGWRMYLDEVGVESINMPKKYTVNNLKMIVDNKIATSIPFLRFNRNFGDFTLFKSIELKNRKFQCDTIICSARLIYEIMMGEDIELHCKKLIVLDSLDTYRSKIGVFPDFDDYFDTLQNVEIVQLSNPATFRDTKYQQKEYYHKMNEKRLKSLLQSGHLKDEYNFRRTGKDKTKVKENSHFENIGKGLFEYLYFQKDVNYYSEGMFMKDGMWHYLNLFGIDAMQDVERMNISKEEIESKLFMGTDDEVLNEII